MTSAEIRQRFLDFFKARGHTIRASDSLIPSGDPTVLLTSAGMNQFKDYFLGKRTDLTRAASCQKGLRAGDLERVGKTASHHSFFEMLGNFSFGDYFKAEAIGWAWEFLTGTLDYAGKPSPDREKLCLELPKEKLWVSVYEDDEEAYTLWRKLGMPAERIKRFGQADNFWPANAPKDGPNGPCGPCSEIYYDADGAVAGPKSVEVWNLVFTQFDRQLDGSLKPLPKPNIDTGMGLERLVRVLQGVETDYETDLFRPIMAAIDQLPKGRKEKTDQAVFAKRAIADHLRAIVFLIADGVLPSNESRGYVLRMLIRRSHRFGRVVLGIEPKGSPAFLASLIPSVMASMKASPYEPTLAKVEPTVRRAIEQEEQQFIETLESGGSRLDELLGKLKTSGRSIVPGDEAFKLYDTYGFPVELTDDIAQEHGLTVDRAGFEKALKVQQQRSRAGSQFGGDIFVPTTRKLEGASRSEFIGYESLEADARVKGIWKQDQWVQQANAGDEVGIILDRSPFYGEAGGQIGDQGVIEATRGAVEVVNATWADDLLVHHAKVKHGTISVNDPVRANVDRERRLKIARSHTATHLLQWALRNVLGPETVQAGSFVEAERVRFDFSSLAAVHPEQQMQVEQFVNARVRAADEVMTNLMKIDEAKQAGALALFGEKYGQQVRVVSIGDYSKELCGGTHLRHTGFVGTFRILTESSIAAGTRRIEALVGEAALTRQQQDAQVLHEASKRLSRPVPDLLAGLDELFGQIRTAEDMKKNLQVELAKVEAKRLVAEGKKIGDVTVVAATLKYADRDVLAVVADTIRASLQRNGVVVLAAADGDAKVSLVMAATSDLGKRIHVGHIVKAVAPLMQGSGGGRPEFAQGGGKDAAAIPAVLQRAEALIREALHA